MNQTLITSLAILKVNFDNSKMYFDNFVPFVVECLRSTDEEDFISLPLLKKNIMNEFGLDLPQNVLEKILRRAKKQGYIEVQKGVYKRNIEKINRTNFREIRQQMLEKHEHVIQKLCEYANERFSSKGLSWTYDYADQAFNEYLIDHHYIVVKKISDKSPITVNATSKVSNNFIIGSFIKDMQESYSAIMDYIEEVVKGDMIAKAIYFPFPEQLQKRFKKTRVYLDTTFLVNALGYAGKTRQDPCIELIELLSETGAELYCFQQTVGEILWILDTCKHKLRSGERRDAFGTLEYFISQNMNASDIEIEIQKVDERLFREFKIRTIDNPDYVFQDNIDVKSITEYLNENIQYKSRMALDNDVTSINSIMRLRSGHKTLQVEECKAIFVTTNNNLSYWANNFLSKEYSGRFVAPTITDIDLTSMLWLKKPTRWPDLPKKRIIADSYASMQPTERQWRLYFAEIEKLRNYKQISIEQYVLLKQAQDAPEALMEVTLGDESAFSKGTIEEIYSLLEENIKKEEKQKTDATKEELLKATREIASGIEKRRLFNQQITDDSKEKATNIVKLVYWPSLFLILVLDVLSIPIQPFTLDHIFRFPFYVIYIFWCFQLAIVIIFGIYNKVYGFNLLQLRDKFVDRLATIYANNEKGKYKKFL